jgi:hypothetical protein
LRCTNSMQMEEMTVTVSCMQMLTKVV